MFDYISTYPQLSSFLYFNSIQDFVNATGVIPTSNDSTLEEYTDGSKRKEYDFAITKIADYSSDADMINIEELYSLKQFIEWVESQENTGSYPNFGNKCVIEKIEVLQGEANLAGTSENGTAKYMFQCRVRYIEEV